MDRRFLSSGVCQFLDEIADADALHEYGAMIAQDEMSFDERLVENAAELRNELRRRGWRVMHRRMDW